ncbi:protein chiffon isoform X1 [Dendroctonus ponderosae]|nr:protein chiffon isoform X1 [Dendroctonus ponderosae]
MLEGSKQKLEGAVKHTRSSSPLVKAPENGSFLSPDEDSIMTRKPIRIRRPRIPILQSGYCAICNLPYNSLEDHVQSKKHQKLIGEDTNYIALNGYIHADVGIESLLSLTGIDAIDFEDFAPKKKRRNMPRTRASSVVSDIVKPPPGLESDVGHRLRSRKTINYTSSSLDEDSFQEKPEIEPVRLEYKEYRELRSSTRALAKLTACAAVKDVNEPELWESGRPKRACINRQKRISADERLVSDNKTYYKVEVLSTKLRSNDKEKECAKRKEAKPNESDKGLIVKFRKLRNSELVQLNNEATNFLFPKKDDTSDEEDEDENSTAEEKESTSGDNSEDIPSSEIDDVKPPDKFKVEDEASMDSTSSDGKRRTKRRSHAEAFIMDNQKYYKFETPGSSSYRLRYHGSYLSPVRTKTNGDFAKIEAKPEPIADKEEKKPKRERMLLNMNEFTFAFEKVPLTEKWYHTFRRQDRVEQRYHFSHNYYWDDFVLPRQIPHLKAIDPRTCYSAYKKLKECKAFAEPNSVAASSGSDAEVCDITGENSASGEASKQPIAEENDEDSKLSEASSTSAATTEEIKEITSNVRRSRVKKKSEKTPLSPNSVRGRNARKSPRQHASTLAILSSLMHQRNRRMKTANDESLQTIPEESSPQVTVEPPKPLETKPTTPQKQRKKKLDYVALAAKLDEELTVGSDFDQEFEPTTDPDVSFLDSPPGLTDILNMCEESKKETDVNCKTFLNGAPGRKPGKRKKNLTGWPNKVKKRKVIKEGNSPTVNGVNVESEEDENSDSIIEPTGDTDLDNRENKCDQDVENRVGNSGEVRDTILQPYVYVKKLDSCENYSVKKIIIKPPNRRTFRRPKRRIVPQNSPKPPRMLRRSKGRWIRER